MGKDTELVDLIKAVDPDNKDKISYEKFVAYLRSNNVDQSDLHKAEKILEEEQKGGEETKSSTGDDRPQRIVTNVHNVVKGPAESFEPVQPGVGEGKKGSSGKKSKA